MLKKTLFMLVSAMLVCMAFVTVVQAGSTFKVDVSSAVDGDTLSVTVTYSDYDDEDGVCCVEGDLKFDSTVLEFKDVSVSTPSEWGEDASSWCEINPDDKNEVILCTLLDSGDTDRGTHDDVVYTVTFKILKKGVDTKINVVNNEALENGILLDTLYASDASLTVTISESGEVSNEVSKSEVSVPEVSEVSEESQPDEESKIQDDSDDPAQSQPDEESGESSDSVTEESADASSDDEGSSNTVVWVIVAVVAVAAIGAGVFFLMKKKK